ncbi:tryptophan 2,3-dioxygenase [Erwinia psidii]|uniref:Tryptophan 2,3-dioxygenase n=2 Tax=Erwinia psidii TaxID=69224 RepID=A0A3N6SE32_9GAMM|nr:tryptophan 2,3-dioxygenase [Erwinia psidii]
MMQCPFSQTKNSTLYDNAVMDYSDYLQLDRILSSQKMLSDVPEEMLFIIQHQTSELWMKLLLHELTQAVSFIRRDDVDRTLSSLNRAHTIMLHLIHAWEVLATLSPVDFLAMRDVLGSASGKQSHQFREIEFLLGNKNPNTLEDYSGNLGALHALRTRLDEPSLNDEVICLLERHISSPLSNKDGVEQAWLQIYQQRYTYWSLYQLGEKLVDISQGFKNWRFQHIATVERIIGHRPGSGGTSGVDYLRSTLNHELFPELYRMRTGLQLV